MLNLVHAEPVGVIEDGADAVKRQTVIGQFFQIDRLVVEGGLSVCAQYHESMWPVY